jgi:outer membrane protein
MRKRLVKFGISVIALSAMATVAQAETLREALEKAYATNPIITGARAGQRANDENVPIARSNGLPDVSVSGSFTENIKSASNSFFSPPRQFGSSLQLGVPLYLGGAVKNAVRAADARVGAGQANLRATEASLFSAVVGAYMDVIRDQAILGLNAKQVAVLGTNLQATRDRFEVGDLTRTDIAQSESRLAIARSNYESAEAQLIGSRERYVQFVGSAPVDLAQPPVLPGLPDSPEAAVAKALADNPDLIAANRAAQAAKFDVGAAGSARLPRIQAVAGETFSSALGSLSSAAISAGAANQSKGTTAGIQFTVPLFQGGGPSAQVRQAKERSGQAIEQVIQVERDTIAQTRTAYASWRASNAVIISSQTAVSAAALSLEGVKAENSVGNRTILDILNAEQELLNAQVQLVSAQRNAYVAGFSLLAAMGDAEARDLGLEGGALYDPNAHYQNVRHIIWDYGSIPDPKPVATRTVDTPAQTPAIVPK